MDTFKYPLAIGQINKILCIFVVKDFTVMKQKLQLLAVIVINIIDCGVNKTRHNEKTGIHPLQKAHKQAKEVNGDRN